MRQFIMIYIFSECLFSWTAAPTFAQGNEKPHFSDSTYIATPRTREEKNSSLEIDDLIIYGERNTVDPSEKETTSPPDILSAPRGLQTYPDKGILSIQESMGRKAASMPDEGDQRKMLNRASLEAGTYATVPFSFFHGNQNERLNYYTNLQLERSSGHVKDKGYQQAFLEGRLNYALDDASSASLSGALFSKSYKPYGRSANKVLDRNRRFRTMNTDVNVNWGMAKKLNFTAGLFIDRSNLIDRQFEDDENWEQSEMNFITSMAANGFIQEHLFNVDAVFGRNSADYESNYTLGLNYFMVQPKWLWTPYPHVSAVIGGTILGYDSDKWGGNSRILPYLKAAYSSPQNIVVSGTFGSTIKAHTLKTLWQDNPFVDSLTTAIPELQPFNFELSAGYETTSAFQVRAGWNIAVIENFPIYSPKRLDDNLGLPTDPADEKHTYVWQPTTIDRYLDIKNITRNQIFLEGTLRPVSALDVNITLLMQSFKDYVAYQPEATMSFAVNYRSKRYVNALFSLNYIGERYVDSARSIDAQPAILEGYQTVNLDLSRLVYKNITALLRLHNLADATTDLWQDYSQPGRMILLGAMAEF